MIKNFFNSLYWWYGSASWNLIFMFIFAFMIVNTFMNGDYAWTGFFIVVALISLNDFEKQEEKGNI